MFGDAGTDNSDASYGGMVAGDSSAWTMQYYREKAVQFQTVLNQIDTAARAVGDALDSGALSDDAQSALSSALDDYNARRAAFRLAAEGINAAAVVINGAGGRMPQLSIPSGLGFLPAIPVAAVAAFSAAAALIAWGVTWLQGVNARMQSEVTAANARAAAADISDPAVRDRVLADQAALGGAASAVAQAAANAEGSPLAQLSGAVKWLVIGAGIWLALRAFESSRRAD